MQKVLVDYDKFPTKCRACQSWKHRVRDCKEQHRRPIKGVRRQPHSFQVNQQDKGGKKTLDEDGFEQVKSRINIRKNIFEKCNDLKKPPTTNQKGVSSAEANPTRTSHSAKEGTTTVEGQHNMSVGQTSKGRTSTTSTTQPRNQTLAKRGEAQKEPTTTQQVAATCEGATV